MPIGVYKRAAAAARWTDNIALDDGGCWLWRGAVDTDGYGRFWWNGGTGRATHFALINAGFPRPLGGYALHSCNEPRCVRPSHLRWGTPAENMADKVAAGHSKCNSGEANGQALLDAGKVQRIRADTRPVRQIADEFGVTISSIYGVKQRRSWAHVA